MPTLIPCLDKSFFIHSKLKNDHCRVGKEERGNAERQVMPDTPSRAQTTTRDNQIMVLITYLIAFLITQILHLKINMHILMLWQACHFLYVTYKI